MIDSGIDIVTKFFQLEIISPSSLTFAPFQSIIAALERSNSRADSAIAEAIASD
jgi:hypothetical protein